MKRIILPLLLCIVLGSAVTVLPQTVLWTVDSKKSVLNGDSEGISVSDSGRITPAPSTSGAFDTGEQFVWATAADAEGNLYVGTGANGKLFVVDSNGTGKMLFDSEELNVSAVAVGSDGTVFAGTSPDGKVYRILKDGTSSVYFEPKTKYIWSLAVGTDGALFVGTGESGKIFRVTAPNTRPGNALYYDAADTHIISLSSLENGAVVAGTDSSGLVLRIDSKESAFALLDSPLREIHEIVTGKDGSVYVLALSESASVKPADAESTKKDEDRVVKVPRPDPATPPVPPTPEKSRYDLSSAKSAVYRIAADGTQFVIWRSEKVSAFSLAAAKDGVYIGTSDRGRIFHVTDEARESLLIQTGDEQISSITPTGAGFAASTSNKGKVFRFDPGQGATGTYSSPVLDAESTASWGRLWAEATGDVVLETRTGNTVRPGSTWSKWQAIGTGNGKIASPAARHLQWRAKLTGGGSLGQVSVSFAPANIPPELLGIEILPPNVGLAPNPPIILDPNIETYGLNPSDLGIAVAPVPPRRVFQAGARSIQWNASDRNGDELEYQVYVAKAGTREFVRLGGKTNRKYLTIDGKTLEDGRYIVKVVVTDSRSRGKSALTGERTSESFDVDNTPPAVSSISETKSESGRISLKFRANETSSRITRAEFNVNGGEWRPVFADDGILDGKMETFTLDVPLPATGRYVIALRVFDAAGNIGTARVAGNN